MPGPLPKPADQRRRRNKPKTPEPVSEAPVVAPDAVPPSMPGYLAGDQVAVGLWDELAPLLVRVGRLRPDEAPSLARLCVAESRFRRAHAEWLASGCVSTTVGAQGQEVRAPVLAEMDAAGRAALAEARQFGLTPMERLALKGGGAPVESRPVAAVVDLDRRKQVMGAS